MCEVVSLFVVFTSFRGFDFPNDYLGQPFGQNDRVEASRATVGETKDMWDGA
jgi:hypothetical protein